MSRAQSANAEPPSGEIAGTVLRGGGNLPAAQVAVSLRSKAFGVFRSILTDREGHFAVQGLPFDSYEIFAQEPGHDSVRTTVRLDGVASNLTLHLDPTRPESGAYNSATVSVRTLRIPEKAINEYQRGLQSLAKKDFSDSLEHFAKATAAFPNYFEAYYHAGVAQLRLGQRDEAMQAFQQAVDASNGKYAKATFGIAAVLLDWGNASEAELVTRRGLEEDENAAEGYLLLGIALLRLSRTDEAEKSVHEALLRSPASAEAYLLSSDIHAQRAEYRDQLHDLETYLALRPNDADKERVLRAKEIALRLIDKENSRQLAALR